MERREVVNNPDEYDSLREQGPSNLPVSSRRTRLGGSPSGGTRPSAPSDGRDWSFPRPTVESIPQILPDQFPSSPSPPDQLVFSQLPSVHVASGPLCLYLGPAGERCYRSALDNGFCPSHQPNASPAPPRDESRARKKKVAATVGVIAALWPVFEELIRQILRLLR